MRQCFLSTFIWPWKVLLPELVLTELWLHVQSASWLFEETPAFELAGICSEDQEVILDQLYLDMVRWHVTFRNDLIYLGRMGQG